MSEDRALSSADLKDQMLADYHRSAKARGLDVPSADMETIVKADLELVDKYHKAVADAPPKAPTAPDPGRENAAVKFAEKRGMQFFKNDIPDDTSFSDVILGARAGQYGPKFDAMMQRVLRIVQVVNPIAKGNISAAIDATEDRKLARELMMMILQYRQWHIGKKRNPYYMPAKDRGRKFLRDLEDVCDRSVPKFGPWWVK